MTSEQVLPRSALLEQGRAHLASLGGRQLTLSGFFERLEEHSGRRLIAEPLPRDQMDLTEVRFSGAKVDYVFYSDSTSAPHQNHVLLRAFTRTALLDAGKGISAPDLKKLMPDLHPPTVEQVVPINHAASDAAKLSDMIATLVGEQVTRRQGLRDPESALKELTPLWEALVDPGITLLGDLDTTGLQLYRTVIELNEAVLRLRPHTVPLIERVARTTATRAGQGPEMTDAFAYAARLESARRSRRWSPESLPEAGNVQPSHSPDYATEVTRLRRVATFYGSSELQALVSSVS